ncbi:hypothetical protein ACFL34_04165 [Candidatus Sumerlaeota bacterium]
MMKHWPKMILCCLALSALDCQTTSRAGQLAEEARLGSLARVLVKEIALLEQEKAGLLTTLREAKVEPPELSADDSRRPSRNIVREVARLEARSKQLKREIYLLKQAAAATRTAEIVSRLSRQVAELRGLALRKPVEFAYLEKDRLRVVLDEALDKQIPPEKFPDYEFALKYLGLIPKELDLKQLIVSLYAEQVGGLYDDETGKLYVMKQFELDSEVSQIILAHEICHALQDQHYRLLDWPIHLTDNDDRATAAAAVVEGDATILMAEWSIKHCSWRVMLDMPQALFLSQQGMDTAPPALIEMLIFPYVSGMNFMQPLSLAGRDDRYEKVFRELPQSTEQILHPAKYFGRADLPTEIALPDFSAKLGPEWSLRTTNVMGELGVRLALAQSPAGRTPSKIPAIQAAAGWDGDRYWVYRTTDRAQWLFAWASVWDTARDAEEFATAYGALAPPGARLERAGQLVLVYESSQPAAAKLFHKLARPVLEAIEIK